MKAAHTDAPRIPVAVVGPTCTGKTALAVALAQRLAPAELINADSRQLRRGLSVATCRPTEAQLCGVVCHLLDLADPGEDFTVADWVGAARDVVARLERRSVLPIVVGGTGLYVSAFVDGFDFGRAGPDPARRIERTQLAAAAGGRAALAAELLERDAGAAAQVDLNNPRRVIRALEILDTHGGSLDAARGTAPRPAVLIGLDAPPEAHAQWIRQRTEAMFGEGALLDEVRSALRRGCSADALAACGIGYAEAIDVVEDRLSVDEAVAATVRRTLRYARSQRSFFRRDRRIAWLQAGGADMDALVARAMAIVDAAAPPD